MKTLYLDCGMGAAGDMLTAALLELHPDPADFLRRLNAALPEEVRVSAAPDTKCGLRGTHVTVLVEGDEEGKEEHHHHHHTDIAAIRERIDALPVPEKVRTDLRAVYDAIAEAESAVHGHPVENIHLHELGSWDALADVLAICWLLYELAPGRILASPVRVGSGMVKCAHGLLPVPAPAAERLLRGVPICAGELRGEMCTPTGAALLKYYVNQFGPQSRRHERRGCRLCHGDAACRRGAGRLYRAHRHEEVETRNYVNLYVPRGAAGRDAAPAVSAYDDAGRAGVRLRALYAAAQRPHGGDRAGARPRQDRRRLGREARKAGV